MPMVTYDMISCAKCSFPFDCRILGFSSGLGPPVIVCPVCKSLIHTDRQEWDDFSENQRQKYLGYTIFYTVAVGLMGGFASEIAHHCWVYGIEKNGIFFDVLLPASLLWAGTAIAIQIYRVHCSLQRYSHHRYRPYTGGLFFNCQVDLQFKVCIVLVALVLGGLGLSKLKIMSGGSFHP